MRRAGLLLVPVLALASPQPAAAQGFFERLFGPPPGQQPGVSPQYRPPPQYRPLPQPLPQPQYRPPQPAPQTQPQRRTQPPQSQQRPAAPQAPQQQAEPAPVVEPPPAPYEKELLRLAEIMGSLAMLRPLCSAPDGSEWSRRMQVLLEAEGTTPGRRERLAGAYNKGYQAYALTYRACTPSAQEASVRFLAEGEQLARNITGRYGG
ncbi:TIGR02301 family protein [Microvirga arsenatis]|uniref:TIGR02301 family protein n=1 Tax=Microvirga arsenatis TaxID=2692265 RepID=A0ABW9Z0L9_9HYPH|nr:TIGR02301 family protein [Microvirga arsenatis]NBJ11379.1 TIGR02301 family protein [Microvirga arsenatis]NBJ25652.1 TIGR02301 family protein [Microvirga arsenatis]